MKYKKWESIINPGLERTRKKKKRSILEEEIDKAIGIEGKDQVDAGVDSVEERPLSKISNEMLNTEPTDAATVDNTNATTATPIKNDNQGRKEKPRQLRWTEITRPEEDNFSYAVDMTEEEKEAFREKRKKLRGVMDELLSWKETQK